MVCAAEKGQGESGSARAFGSAPPVPWIAAHVTSCELFHHLPFVRVPTWPSEKFKHDYQTHFNRRFAFAELTTEKFPIPLQLGMPFRLVGQDLVTRENVYREDIRRVHVEGELIDLHCNVTTDFLGTVKRSRHMQTEGAPSLR